MGGGSDSARQRQAAAKALGKLSAITQTARVNADNVDVYSGTSIRSTATRDLHLTAGEKEESVGRVAFAEGVLATLERGALHARHHPDETERLLRARAVAISRHRHAIPGGAQETSLEVCARQLEDLRGGCAPDGGVARRVGQQRRLPKEVSRRA